MDTDERGLGEGEEARFEKWEKVSNFGKSGARPGKRARRPRGARGRSLHLQKEQPHPPEGMRAGAAPPVVKTRERAKREWKN